MAQDINPEELKKMGFRAFRTTGDGTLAIHPDDVEAFLEYDRRPLTDDEKEYLLHCLHVYQESMKRKVLEEERR